MYPACAPGTRLIHSSGRQRLQLSFPPIQAAWPRWSPDGKRIAFMGNLPGRPWKVYLVSADGGNPQEAMPEEHNEADPNWSADGNSLVFGPAPWAEESKPRGMAIHMLDLKTRQISTLPGSEGLYSPRWSPNGRNIVAQSTASEALLIFDWTTQKWPHCPMWLQATSISRATGSTPISTVSQITATSFGCG
jgi:Tol biopolymer transport system component